MNKEELTKKILEMREDLIPFSKISETLGISKSFSYALWKKAQNTPQVLQSTKTQILPKTLQVKIIQRFFKGEDFETFLKNYTENKIGIGSQRREFIFKQPILKEQLELLKIYTTDFETPLINVAKEKGMSIGQLYASCMRIAVKVVAQNPSIFDKMLTDIT